MMFQQPFANIGQVPFDVFGKRRICFYREGEAPAEPKPSSAGISLSQLKTRQVDLSMQLDLIRFVLLACFIGIGICSGCSADTEASPESMGHHLPQMTNAFENATPVPSNSEPDFELNPSGSKLVAKTDLPSPGRINAFELSGEYHAETTSQDIGIKREIVVIGFVEVDKPSVMVSIDGRTQTLREGESYERITVLEIAPPLARLSCDGVSWNASIFDRRSSSTEVSIKKKLVQPAR